MSRLRSGPGALTAVAMLSGCAVSMQPVADFGAAANHLAVVYKPFAKGLGESCVQYRQFVAIGAPGAFDATAAERDADRTCAPLRQDAATAALFAQALSDYASALAKVAKGKPTVFDKDIKGVGSAVGALDHRDGSAIFDAHAVSAATKIVRAAAGLALEGRERKLTKDELVDNHAALAIVVEAMQTYAVGIYAGQLDDTHALMKSELGRLVVASNAPTQADVEGRLPWRFAQATARAELAANELESRRVRAFAKAADALVAAHQALIDNFDKLGGAQRLALVAEFVTQAQALDDEASAL